MLRSEQELDEIFWNRQRRAFPVVGTKIGHCIVTRRCISLIAKEVQVIQVLIAQLCPVCMVMRRKHRVAVLIVGPIARSR